MANVVTINALVNGTPGTTDTGLAMLQQLKVNMKAAGWTVVQSSNGTSFGATDYWSTTPTAGGSWIVLQGPGSRQICFWVNTTFDQWTGRIIYDKSGGFTFSGATATSPGTLSSTAVYARGSASVWQSWFGGGTKAIKYQQVLCKDVTDGSFWVLGSTPTTSAGSFYHFFAFCALSAIDAGDTDPYAVFCGATSPTADTSTINQAHAGGNLTAAQENAATAGCWWGWSRNSTWRSFQPRYDYLAQTNGDINPYSSNVNALTAFGLAKTEANYREHKGYLTSSARICAITGIANGDTVNEGGSNYAYVAVGHSNGNAPQGLFWWDGTTASMSIN